MSTKRSNIRQLLGTVIICALTYSCASGDERMTPRRQTAECPDGMMLICESRGEPSKGGDEEIPVYERCWCELKPN